MNLPAGCPTIVDTFRRLFAPISLNWQARPLDSLSTMINYLRTTRTSTGLRVRASITRREYPKGVVITKKQMGALNLHQHQVLPKWNYTLLPSR